MKTEFSNAEARRIALAAQGLARPERETPATWARIGRSLATMRLLQIDSVNVLVRSHYLPVFSRAGAYDMAALDLRTHGGGKRQVFEYWAHEASFLPFELYPLMRWKMERARRGEGRYKHLGAWAEANRAYVERALAEVRDKGPIGVSGLDDPGGRSGQWWGWSKGKYVLEYLFDAGYVTAAARQGFERLYDLSERVIPGAAYNAPSAAEADAIRQLTDYSGAALGIATETDLRDYFRLPVDEARRAVAELVEAGRLIPSKVEGWGKPAYLHVEARLPRSAGAVALFSPFDPLVWERERTERLFGFRYRIEIYVPREKRVFGYYVLPFLMGDRFAARVCLKADRAQGLLRVNAAHLEPGADGGATAEALAGELKRMAAWLGLGGVEVAAAGNLHRQLKQAARAAVNW